MARDEAKLLLQSQRLALVTTDFSKALALDTTSTKVPCGKRHCFNKLKFCYKNNNIL